MGSGTLPTGGELAERFFPGTGSSYDRVVRVTTLGLDQLWKRRVLARIPPARRILELACGTGILTSQLLRRFPGVSIVGVDLTEDYLAVAREKLRRRGGDVTLHVGNAETTPVEGPFDAIVSCYIPKYVDAGRLLAHLSPTLRPGGVVVLHDFSYPKWRFPRLVWHLFFLVLDPVARRMFPVWDKVFDRTLKRLIVESKWVRQFRQAFHEHGYEAVRVESLTFGSATVISARKPP